MDKFCINQQSSLQASCGEIGEDKKPPGKPAFLGQTLFEINQEFITRLLDKLHSI